MLKSDCREWRENVKAAANHDKNNKGLKQRMCCSEHFRLQSQKKNKHTNHVFSDPSISRNFIQSLVGQKYVEFSFYLAWTITAQTKSVDFL